MKNIESLKSNLKYLGFGNALNSILEANIAKEYTDFTIGASAQFKTLASLKNQSLAKDTINYELSFHKDPSSESIILNRYKATLLKAENNKNLNTITNTFYLNKGNDITAKEAYNLLSGRAVLKVAEVSQKFDLLKLDANGKPIFHERVASLKEAKDIVKIMAQELENENISFQLKYNGTPIREFNSKGIENNNEVKDLLLIHHYQHANDNKITSDNYSINSFDKAKDLMIKTLSETNEDKLSRDITILDQKSKVTIAKFNAKGHEINLVPETIKENIWIKTDLKKTNSKGGYNFIQFRETYGFDIKNELNKLPILENKNIEQVKIILASLKRGNVQEITLDNNGVKEKGFIEADPQLRTLKLYTKESGASYSNAQDKGSEEKNENFLKKGSSI